MNLWNLLLLLLLLLLSSSYLFVKQKQPNLFINHRR